MNVNWTAFFICICFFNFCTCSDFYSDKVRKYDTETFKKSIGGRIPHFINFFAPWCDYCKRLKPVWDELADKYNVDSPHQKLAIAKVDCTKETPLCSEEGVASYPSLIFYDAAEFKGTKYQGKRNLLGLEEFISKNLEEGLRKKTVPPVNAKPIDSKAGALELTDDNFHTTIDWGMHFVKFYAPWCGHCQKMAHAWEEIAKNYQHDKSITISKVDCTVNKRTCEEFEVKGYPTLLWIVDGKKVEKYQEERNFDGFKKFITKMKANYFDAVETEDGRKSSPNEPNLVVELTNDNFENGVSQGFTFVEFYVPWCRYCRSLAHDWNSLAQKFVTNTDVKIAKVDCNQAETLCIKYKVVGYPSIYLFHNGAFLQEYRGLRKLELFHNYLLEHLQRSEL